MVATSDIELFLVVGIVGVRLVQGMSEMKNLKGLIKPKDGKKSDKYSVNLWRFMVENYYDGQRCDRVYATQWSIMDGSLLPFDKENPKASELFIGRLDETGFMTGSKLSRITSGGKGYKECFAMIPNSYPNAIDVTDWFWSEYIRIGRALWDVDGESYMLGDEGRFTYVGNTKRCNWSGRWYKKKVVKKVKIERREEWVMQ
jgi:hypothetical protein